MDTQRTQDIITEEEAIRIDELYGTPAFVYSEDKLKEYAEEVLNMTHAFGFTPRFAMKAASNRNILHLFERMGLHFDASSEYEVQRLLVIGIPAHKISVSAQEWPREFKEYYKRGVHINVCSLAQLEAFGKGCPTGKVGVRINPGIGSGECKKTTVGGNTASFGIWHEYLDKIKATADSYKIEIVRIHIHIGSGADSNLWKEAAQRSLDIVDYFPSVHTLNLGGGFKVARVKNDKQSNINEIGTFVKQEFENFHFQSGRKIRLEIEPGNYLVARAGCLLAKVNDIVDTGKYGYNFIKLNTGMTDILRPTLYGSQHPITMLTQNTSTKTYIVVGHCCESSDLITTQPGHGGNFSLWELPIPNIGDLCIIGGTGAYCSTMCAKNYNSFPESPEILLKSDKTFTLIKQKQNMQQIIENEIHITL